MKRLTITYDGINLFDADVDEITWSDANGGVSVQGKVKANAPKGLLEMLTEKSRQATENRRTELLQENEISA